MRKRQTLLIIWLERHRAKKHLWVHKQTVVEGSKLQGHRSSRGPAGGRTGKAKAASRLGPKIMGDAPGTASVVRREECLKCQG